jgi:hypothetical protein
MKALILLALAGSLISTVAAAEPTGTLTLACQGTTTNTLEADAKPKPIAMGIVVNFTTRTVQGFGNDLLNYPVEITAIKEVIIAFGGANKPNNIGQHSMISGAIDLVTGELGATSSFWGTTGSPGTISTSYALKCKPTQRIF